MNPSDRWISVPPHPAAPSSSLLPTSAVRVRTTTRSGDPAAAVRPGRTGPTSCARSAAAKSRRNNAIAGPGRRSTSSRERWLPGTGAGRRADRSPAGRERQCDGARRRRLGRHRTGGRFPRPRFLGRAAGPEQSQINLHDRLRPLERRVNGRCRETRDAPDTLTPPSARAAAFRRVPFTLLSSVASVSPRRPAAPPGRRRCGRPGMPSGGRLPARPSDPSRWPA